MRVAIMQPYFFPYIGYFQLLNAVDTFVIYDDIEYTKKGWINRNRLQLNGKEFMFTLPLKKASDYLPVNQRELANSWVKDKNKLLNKVSSTYQNAPYFETVWPLVVNIFNCTHINLFDFILNSITELTKWFNIQTNLVVSSSLKYNSELKAQDKVINLCQALNTTEYINPIGGLELYNKQDFINNHLKLTFINPILKSYSQSATPFLSHLSILDVIMYNSHEEVKRIINEDFELL
ncbi:WbqC family protein [uncultured Psychrosphaera sp.]|uniref:WbqC family protein n=1 Tax=uncultured Psychrosphaera sp. TaxID=1403522 RepID=UPI0026186218|nr:WbqC family protein [uncultured Psychrosphaera sp.]